MPGALEALGRVSGTQEEILERPPLEIKMGFFHEEIYKAV